MNTRYPYLPEGKTIKYVPVSNVFIAEAKNIRDNFSTDLNHPTGAVVVLNDTIIGKGANQSALSNKTFIKIHKDYFCIRKILKIKSGEKYWLCPGCSKHIHHAESRAVRDAIDSSKDISGADLYLYGHWWCCKPCWDTMISAGIKSVYLVDNADNLFKA